MESTRVARAGISALASAAVCGVVLLVSVALGAASDDETLRGRALQQMQDGNYKDAYDALSRLATNPADDPIRVGRDLTTAVTCLQNLDRRDEIDEFREKVVAAHPNNWRLLQSAARSVFDGEHSGFIVAGKFYRGGHRGGGKYVGSADRDRVRALQLLGQAMDKLTLDGGAKPASEVGQLYKDLAEVLQSTDAWRLQSLTDLSTLPDYDEQPYYWGYRGGYDAVGAPVDEKGDVVLYTLPASYAAAVNDGQRWRWALAAAEAANPDLAGEMQYRFASFLRDQFGVQTMAQYLRPLRSDDDSAGKDDEGSPSEVSTLGEDETLCRTADGVKRFKLPDEFNFIKIFRAVADRNKGLAADALWQLGGIFEDRMQYDRAAEFYRRGLDRYPDRYTWREKIDQILGNWCQFGPILTQPAGRGAAVDLRFRNGNKVEFEAWTIQLDTLLADVKAYLTAGPNNADWEKFDVQNVGYRLVEQNQKKYLGEQVAQWSLDLSPKPDHFDRWVQVATPLTKAGAYLLRARMENGNSCYIVLWIADTAIVKKTLSDANYYYVADAVTGAPVAKANVEFFGFRQRHIKDNRYQTDVRNFAELTDDRGGATVGKKDVPDQYQWLVVARTPEGRMAYLGFSNLWYNRYYDAEYNRVKSYLITDRPVYRPGQIAKWKFWLARAQYDKEGPNSFAGKKLNVVLRTPRGEERKLGAFTADRYGGIDGELPLDADATLGVYSLSIAGHGGGSFRVEEYKKPEFEVTVDAPSEPVALGEKITATIRAKYYFGSPVTQAKVKYKVLRSEYSGSWYPMGAWDWFYGPGYWWFASDYPWYPGWRGWGCCRPVAWWWHRSQPQPEVVAQATVPVGKDGTVKVVIDTELAKKIHGDQDHRYEISAEVTDDSRRTITGSGSVLVARRPFKVYAWVNRGHYRAGDDVEADFCAQTIDNKPVQGKGVLKLLKISYDPKTLKPIETVVEQWEPNTDAQGRARQQMKAGQSGQYRLSYTVTDAKGHAIEGGYIFCVRGENFDGRGLRFNDIELVPDRKEYVPGDKVQLMVNTERAGSTVLVFLRPSNGVYKPPLVLDIAGKSTMVEIEVTKKDMPNFFVEAITISDAKAHTEVREIVVPPESRTLNVDVKAVDPKANANKSDADKKEPQSVQAGPEGSEKVGNAEPRPEGSGEVSYKPGQKARFQVKVTDAQGKPVEGSLVVSLYDKSVEYISGGSNVAEIRAFFWKWRRGYYTQTECSLDRGGGNLAKPNDPSMQDLGVFGDLASELEVSSASRGMAQADRSGGRMMLKAAMPMATAAPASAGGVMEVSQKLEPLSSSNAYLMDKMVDEKSAGDADAMQGSAGEVVVRKNFADTAFWAAAITTDKDGAAEFETAMPESLTAWKARAWAMSDGTRVGEGTTQVVTRKDLMVRLQAPRFFVQTDEVVLSANVHNYLPTKKSVRVELKVPSEIFRTEEGSISSDSRILWLVKRVDIDAGGEVRVDWRVKAVAPGTATVQMKAVTDVESDAMEMSFPVLVHGMLKMESFSGVIAPDKSEGIVTFTVPKDRRPEQSRLEVRFSPTLAGAMVDALPYMLQYPYGCTEQTLNRFLPAVVTQRVLVKMGLDLSDIEAKRTNLNAQEIGDDKARAKDWGYEGGAMGRETAKFHNPVFSESKMRDIVRAGVNKLSAQQLSDGGWGWFSGYGEQSWPHTTAVVVHGLQIAAANEVAVVPDVMRRGVEWLRSHQAEQVRLLKLWTATDGKSGKSCADNTDALVFMVLIDAGQKNADMLEFLYRDRLGLAVYAQSMYGLALNRLGQREKLDMVMKNISQYLVQDDENQTAFLRLPESNYWWCWYGSEYEAQAYYLKLLCATGQGGSEVASRLVKYLVNNRKHATYWNSTRDTAVVIEAFADYLKASGEDSPDMTVEILVDGNRNPITKVKIDKSTLFRFENKLVIEGAALTEGPHKVELHKSGAGRLYYNAYVTNFTTENFITKAGLEIKINRKFYKLVETGKSVQVAGSRGQAVDQKVEKYQRQELPGGEADLARLKSGDLVEVELEIDSKNDYEYVLLEDMKAAGFEPVEVRSGYNGNDLGAYVEFRDERVCFFVRQLMRGKHSVSYRLRAEIPGRFSALPAKAAAMYAPELHANSDEFKVGIED